MRNYDNSLRFAFFFLEQSSSKASCFTEEHPEPASESIDNDALNGKIIIIIEWVKCVLSFKYDNC